VPAPPEQIDHLLAEDAAKDERAPRPPPESREPPPSLDLAHAGFRAGGEALL